MAAHLYRRTRHHASIVISTFARRRRAFLDANEVVMKLKAVRAIEVQCHRGGNVVRVL